MKKYLPIIINLTALAAFAGLCALVLYVGANTFAGFDKSKAVILTLAGVVASVFTVPLLHECGHLIFGLLNKMSFHSMKVAFFVFYRSGKRIKIRLVRAGEYAGACEMVPKSADNLYKRFLMMAAGGNIATFLVVAVSLVLFLLRSSVSPYIYFFISAALPVSVYLFFINAMPAGGGQRTDGSVIYGLLKKDAAALATVNILGIQSNFFEGKRPSQIDKRLYFDIPDTDDIYIKTITYNLRYIFYIDSNELEKAREIADQLEALSSSLDENTRLNVLSDCLYESAVSGETEKAKQLYAVTRTYLESEQTATNLRILSAYLLKIENNLKKARIFTMRALDECKDMAILGIAKFEEKLLTELKLEIEEAERLAEQKAKQDELNRVFIFKK